MKEITSVEELRQIQMDIMDHIHEICEKNGIRYTLGGGSLLGAVRHKGYIPWDDDIDLVMLREDYDRLFDALAKEKSYYRGITFESDEDYTLSYGKVLDDRTVMQEAVDVAPTGVFVDVFPIDNFSDDDAEGMRVMKKCRSLLNRYAMKTMRWRKGRALSKNLFLMACKVILCRTSARSLALKLDKTARTSNNENTKRVAIYLGVYGEREIFQREKFEEYIDYLFEDRTYKGIKDYDYYLSKLYGNYMQLPPKEQQVTHHSFKAWWKE